jgi:hypothetical protein
MLRIHLNLFSVTNPQVTKPELIAEHKKNIAFNLAIALEITSPPQNSFF